MVVPRLPLPVRKVLVFAVVPAIEAVGVPPATLIKANLAEPVEVLPSRRSSVMFEGASAPLFLWKYPTMPVVAQLCPLIQMMPEASGAVNVLSAVAREVKVVKKEVFPANCTLPLLAILNLVTPEADAVRIF